MANQWFQNDATGRAHKFIINGDEPTQAEQAKINAYIAQINSGLPKPAAAPVQGGIGRSALEFAKGAIRPVLQLAPDALRMAGGIGDFAMGNEGPGALSRGAAGIEGAINSTLGPAAGYENSLSNIAGETVGTLGSFLIPGIGAERALVSAPRAITKSAYDALSLGEQAGKLAELAKTGEQAAKVRKYAELGTGITMGGAEGQRRVDEYSERTGKPVDQGTRFLAQIIGSGLGTSFVLPVEKIAKPLSDILGHVPASMAGEAIASLTKRLVDAGTTGTVMGVQNAMYAFGQDLAAKGLYDPDVKPGEDFMSQLAAGGAIGAAMHLVLSRHANNVIHGRDSLEKDLKAEADRALALKTMRKNENVGNALSDAMGAAGKQASDLSANVGNALNGVGDAVNANIGRGVKDASLMALGQKQTDLASQRMVSGQDIPRIVEDTDATARNAEWEKERRAGVAKAYLDRQMDGQQAALDYENFQTAPEMLAHNLGKTFPSPDILYHGVPKNGAPEPNTVSVVAGKKKGTYAVVDPSGNVHHITTDPEKAAAKAREIQEQMHEKSVNDAQVPAEMDYDSPLDLIALVDKGFLPPMASVKVAEYLHKAGRKIEDGATVNDIIRGINNPEISGHVIRKLKGQLSEKPSVDRPPQAPETSSSAAPDAGGSSQQGVAPFDFVQKRPRSPVQRTAENLLDNNPIDLGRAPDRTAPPDETQPQPVRRVYTASAPELPPAPETSQARPDQTQTEKPEAPQAQTPPPSAGGTSQGKKASEAPKKWAHPVGARVRDKKTGRLGTITKQTHPGRAWYSIRFDKMPGEKTHQNLGNRAEDSFEVISKDTPSGQASAPGRDGTDSTNGGRKTTPGGQPEATHTPPKTQAPTNGKAERREIDSNHPVFAKLINKLNGYGMHNFTLKLKDWLDTVDEKGVVEGRFTAGKNSSVPHVIELAVRVHGDGLNDDELAEALGKVLDHEVIHHFRNSGSFNDGQWKTLANFARVTKVPGKEYTFLQQAQARYSHLSYDQAVEEAIANTFKSFAAKELKGQSAPKGIWANIVRQFRKISEWYNGTAGAHDIFNGIINGNLKTAGSVGGVGSKQSRFGSPFSNDQNGKPNPMSGDPIKTEEQLARRDDRHKIYSYAKQQVADGSATQMARFRLKDSEGDKLGHERVLESGYVEKPVYKNMVLQNPNNQRVFWLRDASDKNGDNLHLLSADGYKSALEYAYSNGEVTWHGEPVKKNDEQVTVSPLEDAVNQKDAGTKFSAYGIGIDMNRVDDRNLYDTIGMRVSYAKPGKTVFQTLNEQNHAAARDLLEGWLAPALEGKDRAVKWVKELLGSTAMTRIGADGKPEYLAVPIFGKDFGVEAMNARQRARYYADHMIRKLVDRMIPLGSLIDEIKRAGGSVATAFDAYRMNDSLVGETLADLQKLKKEHFDPSVEKIRNLGISDADISRLRGISKEIGEYIDSVKDKNEAALGLYLYALHAPERNLVMEQLNPEGKVAMDPLDHNKALIERDADGNEVFEVHKNGTKTPKYLMHPGDALSGMKTREAYEIIDQMASHKNFSKIEDARQSIKNVIDHLNMVRRDGQLIPKEINFLKNADTPMAKAFIDAAQTPGFEYLAESGYRNFVPLRGFASELDGPDHYVATTARGFSSFRRQDNRSLGRISMAGNIIAHTFLMAEESAMRSRKAAIGRAFLKMIQDYEKDPKLKDKFQSFARIIDNVPLKWMLVDGSYRLEKKFDDGSTLKTQVHGPRALLMHDPNFREKLRDPNSEYMMIKQEDAEGNLREYIVQISDPSLRRAMKGVTAGDETGGAIIKAIGTVTRFLANTVTSWNPEFMFTNFERDIGAALMNSLQYEIPDLHKDVMRNVLPAMKAIWKATPEARAAYLKGEKIPELDLSTLSERERELVQFHKDFLEDGGAVAFLGLRDLADKLAYMHEQLSSPENMSSLDKTKAGFGRLRDFIEAYNTAVENSTRLSVYVSLREALQKQAGGDPVKLREARLVAANAAKNMTANFNRGGEWKTPINALYMFYNASIQGTYSLLTAYKRSPWVRKAFASALVAGMVADVGMASLSDRDKDGGLVYDKIKDWELENKMILMDPLGITDRGYFAIPMPFGYSAIYNFGRAISRYARGGYDVGQALSSALGGIVNAVNPISGTNSLLNFVAPTVLDPAVDLWLNKNFQDRQIAKTPSGYGVQAPQSQLHWNNTSQPSITLADWMNQITGGNAGVSGLIDVSPDTIDYLAGQLTGGAGRFIGRVGALGNKVFEGDVGDILPSDIPFARAVYGNISERNDTERYMELRQRVLQPAKAAKAAAEAGDSKTANDIRRAYGPLLRLSGAFQAADTERSRLITQRRTIEHNVNIPDERKKALIKSINSRIKDAETRAITRYNKEQE